MKPVKNTKQIDFSTEDANGLIKLAKNIDTNKIANEILDWLIVNVENYIDNQSKMFKIDLIIDGESNPPMPETRSLQILYRHIPNDEQMVRAKDVFKSDGSIDMSKLKSKSLTQAIKVRNCLNEITDECLDKIRNNQEKLDKLFERMSFFYEMIGVYKGNPLIQLLNGAVDISKFEYEAFSVDVSVKSPTYKIQREDRIDIIESEDKNYTIAEGFTIWVEIAFTSKAQSTAIF